MHWNLLAVALEVVGRLVVHDTHYESVGDQLVLMTHGLPRRGLKTSFLSLQVNVHHQVQALGALCLSSSLVSEYEVSRMLGMLLLLMMGEVTMAGLLHRHPLMHPLAALTPCRVPAGGTALLARRWEGDWSGSGRLDAGCLHLDASAPSHCLPLSELAWTLSQLASCLCANLGMWKPGHDCSPSVCQKAGTPS